MTIDLTPRASWKAGWQKMIAAKHPAVMEFLAQADATVAGTAQYGDIGQWATIAYAATGDPKYAAAAWKLIGPAMTNLVPLPSGDLVQDRFAPYCLFYAWLKPALTPDQLATFETGLRRVLQWIVGRGIRVPDADLLVGIFLGMEFCAAALNDPTILAGTFKTPAGQQITWQQVTDAVAQYFAANCAGGELDYPKEYCSDFMQIGLLAPKYAPGLIPSLDAMVGQIAVAEAHGVDPGRKTQWCRGDSQVDTQKPAAFTARLWRLLSYWIALRATDGATANSAPLASIISDLAGKDFTPLDGGGEWRWALFLEDADDLMASTVPALTNLYAPGMGVQHVRRGTSALHIHASQRYQTDHLVNFDGWADVELVREGIYILGHPIGYGGPSSTPYGLNTCAVCGLGSMQQRGVLAQGVNANYAWLTCETNGPRYAPPYFNAPGAWCTWRRTLVYSFTSETLVAWDQFNFAFDPRTRDLSRYRPADQKTMGAALALQEQIWHMPVQPTVSGGDFSWKIANGPEMHGLVAAPAGITLRAIDESTLWGTSHNYGPGELGWQVRALGTSLANQILTGLRPQAPPKLAAAPAGTAAFILDGNTLTFDAGGNLQ